MKKLLFIFAFSISSFGCTNTQPPSPDKPQTFIQCVQDNSLSYQFQFDSLAISVLMYKLAETGGVLAYSVINDNATRQTVWLTEIKRCDTGRAAESSNIYLKVRNRQENRNILDSFQLYIQQKVSEFLAETRKHQPSQYTDLQHGLELCSTACEPTYRGYKKYIIIMSDMLLDVPDDPHAHLQPIYLCKAISVFIVRRSPVISVDSLKGMFPNSEEVVPFTTLQSAINYINK